MPFVIVIFVKIFDTKIKNNNAIDPGNSSS